MKGKVFRKGRVGGDRRRRKGTSCYLNFPVSVSVRDYRSEKPGKGNLGHPLYYRKDQLTNRTGKRVGRKGKEKEE